MLKQFIENKTLGFFVKTHGVFSKPLYSGIGHILCFHRVLPQADRPRIWQNAGMEISPDHLEFILKFFIEKKYQFINLDDLYQTLSGKKKKSGKFIAITFDDGYMDNFSYAYPLLKKLGVPFTIYVSTSFPDRKAIMWSYLLEEVLLRNEELAFSFNGKAYDFLCDTFPDKEKAFLEIRRIIIENEKERPGEILSSILRSDDKRSMDYTDRLTLTWQQIKELSGDPLVTIGSHAVNHYALSRLSEMDAMHEISNSKKIIEKHISKAIDHFAYPYGSHNEVGKRECELAIDCGYKTAVTLLQANVFPGSRNHLTMLPRIPLGVDTTKEKLNYITNGIHHFGMNKFRRTVK
jgi:peptidoglycan/xylan/chitin deacetylase (PgdA/CDA1 family)